MRLKRNREAIVFRGDFFARRHIAENTITRAFGIRRKNLIDMRRLEPTFRVLTRHLIDRIDKENLSLLFFRLGSTANHNARFHRGIVKEIRGEANYALQQIGIKKRLANLSLFFPKQHPVRQEDCAAACLRIH